MRTLESLFRGDSYDKSQDILNNFEIDTNLYVIASEYKKYIVISDTYRESLGSVGYLKTNPNASVIYIYSRTMKNILRACTIANTTNIVCFTNNVHFMCSNGKILDLKNYTFWIFHYAKLTSGGIFCNAAINHFSKESCNFYNDVLEKLPKSLINTLEGFSKSADKLVVYTKMFRVELKNIHISDFAIVYIKYTEPREDIGRNNLFPILSGSTLISCNVLDMRWNEITKKLYKIGATEKNIKNALQKCEFDKSHLDVKKWIVVAPKTKVKMNELP